mgnify:FL=1
MSFAYKKIVHIPSFEVHNKHQLPYLGLISAASSATIELPTAEGFNSGGSETPFRMPLGHSFVTGVKD